MKVSRLVIVPTSAIISQAWVDYICFCLNYHIWRGNISCKKYEKFKVLSALSHKVPSWSLILIENKGIVFRLFGYYF